MAGTSGPKGTGKPRIDTESVVDPEARFGEQLRAARMDQGLSIRALARQLGVSASFLSQVENDKARPSVATLYAITNALDISIDELFSSDTTVLPRPAVSPENLRVMAVPERPAAPAVAQGASVASSARSALFDSAAGAIVGPEERRTLQLNSGVTWERLATVGGSDIDFLLVTYDVGGSSTLDERLMRHTGVEYGYILRGQLEIVLGFESVVLSPGDSIAFDSTTPHRLQSVGDVPVEAVWLVHGRSEGVAPG